MRERGGDEKPESAEIRVRERAVVVGLRILEHEDES